jgi:hypothetical protein
VWRVHQFLNLTFSSPVTRSSCISAKNGSLQLDRAIVTREVGFYALAIVLLYIALQDVAPEPDDPTGPLHIYVSFWEACMVFGGYILYVIVCANMEAIVAFFTKAKEGPSANNGQKGYGSIQTYKVVSSFELEVSDSSKECQPLNVSIVSQTILDSIRIWTRTFLMIWLT